MQTTSHPQLLGQLPGEHSFKGVMLQQCDLANAALRAPERLLNRQESRLQPSQSTDILGMCLDARAGTLFNMLTG